MGRREEVLRLLTDVRQALDDDDIGDRLDINRHYVNKLCRDLADEGLVRRERGIDYKYVNRVIDDVMIPKNSRAIPAPKRRRSIRQQDRVEGNISELIETFDSCVQRFEANAVFPGPSLYFHERALDRRRRHFDVDSLMTDKEFFEYVYAVLPSWGMHRMGKQAAKVGSFHEMVTSFQTSSERIAELWDLQLSAIDSGDRPAVAHQVWEIIFNLKVSTSRAHIVAGSKALHHVLPELVPPIDRQYTFRFFTGQTQVLDERKSFLVWFPHLSRIAHACRSEIGVALERGGFMATGPAKVVDNAIMGFMQMKGVVTESDMGVE